MRDGQFRPQRCCRYRYTSIYSHIIIMRRYITAAAAAADGRLARISKKTLLKFKCEELINEGIFNFIPVR